ncbi:uncharacterized protein V1513DRAFT_40711 [Lipomyces chichibuensis]|uniref:uncharacterized protein n=1 Tax=Lipomyces chichibuensis TaxID=1546026 RepID=UPI0033442EC6
MSNNLDLSMDYSPSPAISPHSGSFSRNESTASTISSPAIKLFTDRLALFTVNVDPLVILSYGTTTLISQDPRMSLGAPGEIWHDLELMALIRAYHAAVNVCQNGSCQRFFGIVDDVWRRIMARLMLPVKPTIAPMYLEHVWMNILASFRTIAYHIIKNNGRPWYDYSKAYHAQILNSLPSITPQIYYELESRFSHSFTSYLHSKLNGLPPPCLPLDVGYGYLTHADSDKAKGQVHHSIVSQRSFSASAVPISKSNLFLAPSSSVQRKRSESLVNSNFRQSTGHATSKERLSAPSGPIRSNISTTDTLLFSFRTLYSKIVAGRTEDMISLREALTMSLFTEGADSNVGNEILSAIEEYTEFEEMITFRHQVFCERLIAK